MPQFLEGGSHFRISWVKSGHQGEQRFQIELKTTVLQVDRYNKILFDEPNRIIGNTVISFLITKAVITTHCIKSFENFELQTSRSKHCGAILKKILKMVTAVLRTKRL